MMSTVQKLALTMIVLSACISPFVPGALQRWSWMAAIALSFTWFVLVIWS
jgi:hypothetical protein